MLNKYDVERNSCGEWSHPEYQCAIDTACGDREYLTDVEWLELKRELGIDIKILSIDCDKNVTFEMYDQFVESESLMGWNPEIPEGYELLSIFFTEESAVALFYKNVN